jgi:DUF1365 family protein
MLKPIVDGKIYKTQKQFFVSPFFQTEGHYEFRFFCDKMLDSGNKKEKGRVSIFINYFKGQDIALETSLICSLKNFDTRNSFPYIFTTFKTVILIGFQAFVLKFIKKVKFRRAPKQLNKNTTTNIL